MPPRHTSNPSCIHDKDSFLKLLSDTVSLCRDRPSLEDFSDTELKTLVLRIKHLDNLRDDAISQLFFREEFCSDEVENGSFLPIQHHRSDTPPNVNETQKNFSCKLCEKYDSCTQPCELVDSMLPGKLSGSHHLKNTLGSHINEIYKPTSGDHSGGSKFRMVEMTPSEDQYSLYKKCPPGTFTDKQWEAVSLRFKNGLKQKEIADSLRIPRSAVSDRLRRAKTKMEEFYKSQHVKRRQGES